MRRCTLVPLHASAEIWKQCPLVNPLTLQFPQVVTGIGATMQITYLMYFGMWAVVIPLSCQLVFLLYLSCLRAYFERPANKREAVAITEDQDGADTEPSENRTPSASTGGNPDENDPHGHGAAVHDIGQQLL